MMDWQIDRDMDGVFIECIRVGPVMHLSDKKRVLLNVVGIVAVMEKGHVCVIHHRDLHEPVTIAASYDEVVASIQAAVSEATS